MPSLTFTKTRLFQLVEVSKWEVYHSDLIKKKLTIYCHNIESYNSTLCGDKDGVGFNVRDQVENTEQKIE